MFRIRRAALSAVLIAIVISGSFVGRAEAQVSATIQVCGTVTLYVASTAVTPGLISIGGLTYPIAAGTNITNANLISVGADLCLTATLNVNAQIVSPASVQANVSTTISICGVVTAYVAATLLANGSITIGNRTLPIAAGAAIENVDLIAVGVDLCLSATLDGLGRIVVPSSVTLNTTTSIHVCGTVSAYAAATASALGSIVIGGQSYPIAAGTTIDNADLIVIGADLCLDATLNSLVQIVAPSSVSANVTTTVNVCGLVTAYVAATASAAGSITIAGQHFDIAAGTVLENAELIEIGVNLCLQATVNATGDIVAPSSVSLNATTTISVCGEVTAYAAARPQANGSITIGGLFYQIAAGTVIENESLIRVRANLCLSATLNASGQIIAPSSVTANVTTTIRVCGSVSAYVAATSTENGAITIAAQRFVIAAGTVIDNAFIIRIGASICLSATINVLGQIIPPTIATPENHPPLISVPGAQQVAAGATLTFAVTASDPDGDAVELSSNNVPDNGSFSSSGAAGEFTFTPDAVQVGQVYNVGFTATDSHQATASATVEITVTAPGDGTVDGPPVISVPPSPILVDAGSTLEFTVTGSTPVPNCSITVDAAAVPPNATFGSATGTGAASGHFSFTPTEAQVGRIYTVVFTARDCRPQSVSATVTIIVSSTEPGVGHLCVPVTRIIFDDAPIGGSCGWLTITLVNTGPGFITLGGADFLDGTHFQLEGNSPSPVQVAPGRIINLKVTFAPTGPGVHNDSLRIVSSDPEHPVTIIRLRGRALVQPEQ